MHEDIRLSRLRVSRRRALSIGGTVSLGGLIAACGGGGGDREAAGTTAASPPPTSTQGPTPARGSSDLLAALDDAPSCVLAKEATQGPYWFDVDAIRRDIREGRPGTRLHLALRVQDMSRCEAGGEPAPVADAVVEIWHCDAGGEYSGFESMSAGTGLGGTPPEPPGGSSAPPPPPDAGQPGGHAGDDADTSDGSYSQGVQEADPTDDGRYLRGAQVTDGDGVVRFTTIYPGWYRGRTVHIHLKVHIDRRNVLTSQLYMDDAVTTEAFKASPYDERPDRDTFNDDDSLFDRTGLLAMTKEGDGYRGVINLGLNA
jgi:protocatechuate 3,4-dioxygenase beta subunit